MSAIGLSEHAVARYRQRVRPTSSLLEARLMLGGFVAMAHVRPNPRHWMRAVLPAPGLTFYYWAGQPDVCVLVREGVAVTVITCQGRLRVDPAAPVEI